MYISTRDFGPLQREAVWRDAVNSHCGEFQFEFDRPGLLASLQIRRLGSLPCARLDQSMKRVFRRDAAAMRAQTNDGFVILQLSGRARISQFDRQTSLAPGDVTLIDAGAPFEMNLFERNSQICIHIPKDRLADHIAGWEGRFGCKMPPSTNYLLHSLVGSAFGLADCFDDRQGEILANAVLGLLAAGWQTQEAGTPIEMASETLQRVKSYILANLTDETLNPRMIASATAISERNLHRMFSAIGQSVSNWIRQCRLERCASDFRNPGCRQRSITEIAFGWGFNDSAHFSRLFRKEFGVPPRDYRRSAEAH